jgi:hypothetical protein
VIEGRLVYVNTDEVVELGGKTQRQYLCERGGEPTRDFTPGAWLAGVFGFFDCKHRTAFVYALRSCLAIEPLGEH